MEYLVIGMARLLRSRRLVRGLFAMALVLATWPAWRVTSLGSKPTLAELVQLTCTTLPPQPPVSKSRASVPPVARSAIP